MGNNLTNCFNDSTSKNEIKSQGDLYDEKKITKVQAVVRRRLTMSAVMEEKIEVLSQNFEREFIGVYGKYVDPGELNRIRGEALIEIERNFKEKNKIPFTALSPRESNDLCFRKLPVLLKDGSIYEGLWTKNKEGEYVKQCYGCVYFHDGMKIEGIWEDGKISTQSDSILYYPNGVIYFGLLDENFSPDGTGCMHYPKGKSISTTWVKGSPEGECIISLPEGMSIVSKYSRGKLDLNHGTISYSTGTVYKGQFRSFNNKFYRHGVGISSYPNGNYYKGNWDKDRFHGPGEYLFNEITKEIEDEILLPSTSPGAKIKANWNHGVLTGEGFIITKDNISINCIWRYGKIIYTIQKLVKNKIVLHHRIFDFVSVSDLEELSKLRNRNILDYLKKDSFGNLIRLRFNQILRFDKKFYDNETGNSKLHQMLESGSNMNLNLSKVFLSFLERRDEFIPFVGYGCNGGYLEKRFHYSNMFNPRGDTAYSSNYLGGPLGDIEILGEFMTKFYKDIHKESRSIQISSVLPEVGRLLNNDDALGQFEPEKVEDYIPLYDQHLGHYGINYNSLVANDAHILDTHVDLDKYICCIHQIVITIPIKLTLYTVLYNPVRTFAIYLNDTNQDNMDPIMKDQFVVDREYLHNYSTCLQNSFKGTINIMKSSHTSSYDLIEFDTTTQTSYRYKLLALVTIKEYGNPIVLNLKRYHHQGNKLLIRLIDQNVLYDAKRVGIEVGSICFFGGVFLR